MIRALVTQIFNGNWQITKVFMILFFIFIFSSLSASHIHIRDPHPCLFSVSTWALRGGKILVTYIKCNVKAMWNKDFLKSIRYKAARKQRTVRYTKWIQITCLNLGNNCKCAKNRVYDFDKWRHVLKNVMQNMLLSKL